MLQTEVTQQQQLEHGILQVHAAGQGCMTLVIVSQKSSAMLVGEVMKGSAYARTVLHAADRLLRTVHRRSRVRALPCLLCDANVMWRGEPPGAVGVLLPFGVTPGRVAVGLAFCAACAEGHAESGLAQAAVTAFRAGMMPDVRVFQPTEAGHA